MKKHALVIGGTGMLQAVSVYLASEGFETSVVARTKSDLNMLVEDARKLGGLINPIPLDYTNEKYCMNKLREVIKEHGKIDVVVAWIHNTCPTLALAIAEQVKSSSMPIPFYQIFGSDAANPEKENDALYNLLSTIPGIDYHKIILGFKIENGNPRWLRNKEIADGIVEALQKKQSTYIVGMVEPYSQRPLS